MEIDTWISGRVTFEIYRAKLLSIVHFNSQVFWWQENLQELKYKHNLSHNPCKQGMELGMDVSEEQMVNNTYNEDRGNRPPDQQPSHLAVVLTKYTPLYDRFDLVLLLQSLDTFSASSFF